MTREQEQHDRVLAVVRENAASLLRVARRHSICGSDAEDAYQRALVIYLERVDRVRDATAGEWLRTVVKHEAMAIREQRQRVLPHEEVDFDGYAATDLSEGDERVLRFDRVTRAAEALQRCKTDEATALMLKAEGRSYDEIGQLTGWSYTKVNRCLAEGRARFLKTYAAIEAGRECERFAPVLSAIADGEATARDVTQIRPHLHNCAGCRATLRELHDAQPAIRVVLPAGVLFLPSAADAGVGVLTRLYEFLAGGAQDAALRVQNAVEAVGSGKAAAVAASAAAIAGGGIAVDQAVLEPDRDAQAAAVVARVTPTPTPTPAATPVARTAVADAPLRTNVIPAIAAPGRRRPAVATATPAPRSPKKPRPSTESSGEFFGGSAPAKTTTAAPAATTSTSKPTSAPAAGGEGEFFNP